MQHLWGTDNPLQPRADLTPLPAAASQLLINGANLQRALLHFQRGKAADALGWNQHTWSQLAQWPSLKEHVLLFLDHMLRDRLPPAVSRLAHSSRLIPLHKAAVGTLRPIAIPTLFRKTISTVTYQRWVPQARQFVGADQHGVGLSQGTAIMAEKVSQYLNTSDNHIAVGLDLSNAFGTIARTTVIRGLQAVDTALASSQTSWLQTSSLGILNNADPGQCCHWTNTGIPQGDPLSAMAFACALECVFRDFRAKLSERGLYQCLTPCYIDDVVLLTTREQADTIFDVFCEVASQHNLHINAAKTCIYTRHAEGPVPGDLRQIWTQQSRKDGITIGGLPVDASETREEAIPIGHESYVQAFLDDKLRTYRRCCEVLMQLPQILEDSGVGTHVAFTLLRCSVTAKPGYLLAALDEQSTRNFAAKLDEVTTGTLCALLQNPLLGHDQLAMLRRPVRAGGFGFPSFQHELRMLRVHHVILLAHTASSSGLEGVHPGPLAMQQTFRQFAEQFNTEVANILNKDSQSLLEEGFRGGLRRMRRWLYGLHDIPLQDQRRHLAMTAWLVAPQGTFVVDKVWRTTMRIRPHLPVCVMTQPCRYVPTTTNQPCRAHVDEWGRHAQHCCRQVVQARHHALRNLWSELAKSAGWHCAMEQEVQTTTGQKRADLLLTCPGGTRQAVDVTVTHQQSDSAAEAARKARERKERHYLGDNPTMRLPGGEILVPVVHVAGGYLENAALDMAEKICTDLAAKLVNLQGHTVPVAKHCARHRVYGSLMRALAQHEVRVLEASSDLL